MPMTDPWKTSISVAPSKLIDPSLELHWAAQFLASFGQTFAEKQDDDSHRAMEWDAERRAFVSAPTVGPYPFRVGLRPEDLTLLLLDRTTDALGSLPLAGNTRDQGYEWLSLGLASYMGGPPAVIERPEYEMPEHPVSDRAPFSENYQSEYQALAGLYGASAELLREVVTGRDDAAPIRCWPHHFDIGTLITIASDPDGTATSTVGVGFAPMGGGYESWYWYVTPWPYPDPDALPTLPDPGAWHTDGWTGAVLTGEDVMQLEEAARRPTVHAFVTGAVEAATAALAG
jgi:hypothetical protein